MPAYAISVFYSKTIPIYDLDAHTHTHVPVCRHTYTMTCFCAFVTSLVLLPPLQLFWFMCNIQ